MTWRPVDRSELLSGSGDDPYLHLAAGAVTLGVLGEHGWAALHRWRPSGHWGGAAVVDPAAPAEAESTALAALLEAAPDVPLEWFSTANGRGLRLPKGLDLTGAVCWDFLSTRTAPAEVPVPNGLELVTLDDAADATAIEAFATAHNDDFEGFPGRGFSLLWRALRDRTGQLVAVGALHELDTGLPHLSGLVVHSGQRRLGLGRLLTVDLTRAALDRAGVCTLGVFHENHPALRLYHSLGYTTHHSFHTRDLVRT